MQERLPTLETTRLSTEQLRVVMHLFQKAHRVVEVCIEGRSMQGALPDGTRIHLQCQTEHVYSPGEVVVFLEGPHIIVHRVVSSGYNRRGQRYLITQGDAMLLPDAPVLMDAVVGPVIADNHQGHWQAPAACAPRGVLPQCMAHLALIIVRGALILDFALARSVARTLRSTLALLLRWRGAVWRFLSKA